MYMGVKINTFIVIYLHCVYNLIYSYSRDIKISDDTKTNVPQTEKTGTRPAIKWEKNVLFTDLNSVWF